MVDWEIYDRRFRDLTLPNARTVANLTFGGPRRNRLFIAGHSSLYAMYVNARGAQEP